MSIKFISFYILLVLLISCALGDSYGCNCLDGKCKICFPCSRVDPSPSGTMSFFRTNRTMPFRTNENRRHRDNLQTWSMKDWNAFQEPAKTPVPEERPQEIQDNERKLSSWFSIGGINKLANEYMGILLIACFFLLLILNIQQWYIRKLTGRALRRIAVKNGSGQKNESFDGVSKAIQMI